MLEQGRQKPGMCTFLFFLALCIAGTSSLKICSFNIRSFGGNKLNKPEVLEVITKCITRCDVMLVMEIKDAKGQVFPELVAHINRGFDKKKKEFDYVISERLGRKSYKEQYGFIYRRKLVSVRARYQYPDMRIGDEDAFSREPFIIWFSSPKTAVKEFVIIPIHTTPEVAVQEIDKLYDVHLHVRQHWTSKNFILMGDFNAACSYVAKKQWKNIRLRSDSSFVWLTDDKTDTTVRESTNCAYDRVVLHGENLIKAVSPDSVEVFDFRTAYGLTEEQALAVSDHFPVALTINRARQRGTRTGTFTG